MIGLRIYTFTGHMLNKYFRKNRVHGGKVLVPSMCENQRRNNNLTSWKRNAKISWNYHENNFTWGEIVASIDKKQINSYDLTKRVHACFSRDIFFVMTHDGKFSLGEHPVFSKGEKRGTEGNRSAVRGLGYGKFCLSWVSLSPDSPRVFTVGSCIKIRSSSWLK